MNNTTLFVNSSHLADDPFDEDGPTDTFDVELFFKYCLTLFKVLADIFIIYSTKKFRILKTWENSLVMHWALVDLIFVIFYFVYAFLGMHTELLRIASCLIMSVLKTLCVSTIVFGNAILLGFVLINSKCNVLNSYESAFKKFYIYMIYVFCFLECFVEYFTCRHRFDNLIFVTHTMVVFSLLTNIFLSKVIKYDGHVNQTYYMLYISNVIVFSLIPTFVYHHLFNFFRSHEGFIRFLESTMFIPFYILISNSVMVLCVLYRHCRDFRTVVMLVFKKLILHSGVSWNELQQDV